MTAIGRSDRPQPGYTRPMPEPAALPEPEHEAEVRPPAGAGRAAAGAARRRSVTVPAAIAAATGGFLLGVATFVLVRILRRPRVERTRGAVARTRGGKKVDVAATRSFLVDVHLLKDR